jgi:hypothetical protein
MVVLMMRSDEALVNLHAQAEAVVPEGEDDRFVGKLGGTAATVDAVAQCGRDQAQGVRHHQGQCALAA